MLLTDGPFAVHQVQRSLSASTTAWGRSFSEEVFTFVLVKPQELSTCTFLYLAEVLLNDRPTLQHINCSLQSLCTLVNFLHLQSDIKRYLEAS